MHIISNHILPCVSVVKRKARQNVSLGIGQVRRTTIRRYATVMLTVTKNEKYGGRMVHRARAAARKLGIERVGWILFERVDQREKDRFGIAVLPHDAERQVAQLAQASRKLGFHDRGTCPESLTTRPGLSVGMP
jgi:hypothetical protein